MSQIAKKTGNLEEIQKLKHETFANCLRSNGIIKIQFIRNPTADLFYRLFSRILRHYL